MVLQLTEPDVHTISIIIYDTQHQLQSNPVKHSSIFKPHNLFAFSLMRLDITCKLSM